MLGKLLKYDMRYVARLMPFMYLVAFVLSLFTSLIVFSISKLSEMSFILVMTVPFLLLALVVVAYSGLIMVAMRIYKSLYSDEGYLTFTLPVTPTQLIWSKILLYVIWELMGIIVAIICIALPILTALFTFADQSFFDAIKYFIDILWYTFKEMFAADNFSMVMMIVVWVLFLLISFLSAPIAILFSFSVGQFANKHRVISAIGIYFAYSMVLSILFSILELFIYIPGILASANEAAIGIMSSQFTWYTFFCALLTVIVSSICYLVTKRIMTNKLNLV